MSDVKWYLDSACIIDAETNEIISTRALIDIANKMHNELNVPVSRAQTKTVADAVERLGKEVLSHEWDVILYDGDSYYPVSDSYAKKWEHQIICTREQFEACVKEQEGEKWTHIDAFGDPCRILIEEKDALGYVVILRQSGHYAIPSASSLKPVKSTISEAEAWRKAQDGHPVEFIMEKYNVVEKD